VCPLLKSPKLRSGALRRVVMKLLEFLAPEAIISDLQANSKKEAIRALVDAAMAAGGFAEDAKEAIVEAVLERESKGSTGLGGGVALPHIKGTELVTEMCGAFARSLDGVNYESVDGNPVYVLFLIISPKAQLDKHISILRSISELRENEHYLQSFRQADDQEALARLIGSLGDHE